MSAGLRFFVVMLGIPLFAAPLFAAPTRDFDQIAHQAEQALSAEHLNEAIGLYQEGLTVKPSWSEGWWALGSLLYDQDRFAESQAAFRRFVVVSPKPGPGYAFLGLCEYETQNYPQALQHFRAWADRGWSGTPALIDVSTFHFALLLTREGKFVEALYLLAAEAEKNHSGAALTEAMGLASLRMRNVPEDYPPQQREMVWLAGKAAFYAALHPPEYDVAEDYANRLRAHYEQTPNVHYFLGTLLKFEDKYDDAAEEFRRELKISPKDAGARVELARLSMINNKLDDALALAREAAQLQPQDFEVHYVYGQVLLKLGKSAESARELETAEKLAPDSAPVRFQLAEVYRKLNRTRDAERETAAFNLLKDKQQVMISPVQKFAQHPELLK